MKKENSLNHNKLNCDGVISTDINGNIKIMNRVAEQLTDGLF